VLRQALLIAVIAGLLGCGPAPNSSAVSTPTASNENQVAETGTGAWVSSEEKSAMGDRANAVASIFSDNELRNSIGMGEKVQMLVRCADNKTDTLFMWPAFVGISDGLKVEFKIDDGPIFSHVLSPAGSGDAFGFWGGSESVPFIRRLADAKRLVVRAAGYNETSQEAIFDVTGIAKGTASVQSACGWILGGK
jgi:hypothetical protein